MPHLLGSRHALLRWSAPSSDAAPARLAQTSSTRITLTARVAVDSPPGPAARAIRGFQFVGPAAADRRRQLRSSQGPSGQGPGRASFPGLVPDAAVTFAMPPEHGATRYTDYGCRFEVCRATHAQRHSRLRAQRATGSTRGELLARVRHSVDVRQPRLSMRAVRRCAAGGEPATSRPGSQGVVIAVVNARYPALLGV